jgi:hypothetical protein
MAVSSAERRGAAYAGTGLRCYHALGGKMKWFRGFFGYLVAWITYILLIACGIAGFFLIIRALVIIARRK